MYESLSGHKNAPGGCILAHEMGLGKTLQTITVLWTLFEQSPSGLPTISNALILCPSSLVRNWAAEIVKWLGAHRLTAYQVLSSSREQTLKVIEGFQRAGAYGKPVLIMSYESFRAHVEVVTKGKVDLLICDEGHRLKNGQSGISGAVSQLRTPRKLLLTGTPVQNNLDEFFALISLVRPGMLGTSAEFKKAFARHILRGRDTDCSEEELARSRESSRKLMELIRPIFLRRSNRMLARYLPPKVEQIVFVTLSPLQRELSRKFLSSKLVRNAQAGNRKGALESLTVLTKLCNHPSLIFLESLESDVAAKKEMAAAAAEQRRAEEAASAPSPPGVSNARQLMNCEAAVAGVGAAASASPSSSVAAPKLRPHLQGMADVFPPNFRPRMLDPAWSGKLNFVCKLLHTVKTTTQDRVVLVSNYTRTLDLIEQVFRLQRVTLLRLDGSVSTKQRQDIVDLFNSPRRLYDCILLSSKASGCGLNLVGANRLVMFDPDWNPATDQQAMARVWRDGQKRPVFIYRLFSTGTIEEKMFQRQLFKLSVADSVAEDRGAADQTDPAEDESGGDPEPVDCDGEVDAAAEETAEDLDDEELNDLFSYNESTVCETQEKIKGAFTQWKRFRGVQLVEDLCLKVMLSVLACVARLAISSAHAEREPSQRAGADLVTFVMCKYFNRAGLRDALIAEQRRPAPPRSA
jgi:DNA repair and recombination RAD54-like protein